MKTVTFDSVADLVGQEIGFSEWINIDQERVNNFAEATGDFQWIHIDVERATEELGGTVVHGFLSLSLIPVLLDQIVAVEGVASALNYGSDKVRFVTMVKVGSRVRLRLKVLGVEPKLGGLLVRNECTIEIEGEAKPACVAEILILYRPA